MREQAKRIKCLQQEARLSETARIADQLRRAFQGNAWHGDSLLEILNGVTAAQVRIAWNLALGPHVLAIPGTGDPQHLEQNVAAAALRLTGDELARLADLAGCPVDLLDLRAASTVMQYQVITTGQRWWAKDAQAALYEAAVLSEKTALDSARAALLADIGKEGSVYGR